MLKVLDVSTLKRRLLRIAVFWLHGCFEMLNYHWNYGDSTLLLPSLFQIRKIVLLGLVYSSIPLMHRISGHCMAWLIYVLLWDAFASVRAYKYLQFLGLFKILRRGLFTRRVFQAFLASGVALHLIKDGRVSCNIFEVCGVLT